MVALDSLRSAKLRSFLTLLGIILATSTLIAVMSLIHGMDVYVSQIVSDMGVDGFQVVRMAFLGNWDPKKFLEFQRKNPELRPEEFEFLRDRAKLLSRIGMQTFRRAKIASGNQQVLGVSLQGVSAVIPEISNIQPQYGRMFQDEEDRHHLAVAFIGNDLRETFFPNTDPAGKTIFVEGRPFTVLGTAKSMGSEFGQSRDNFVLIPVETYFKMFGSQKGISYQMTAIGHDRFFQAQDEVRMLLRAFRKVRPADEDNFALLSADAFLQLWDRLTSTIAATAVAVVSVFMVVGGVVIMNIMMAVVSERTQEIGVRKSLGARRSDILRQFLVEAAVLAASGGIIGVATAWILAIVVRNTTPVPMEMPLNAVLVGVGLSAAVGLFFGIYPASRASKLDPIVALRVER